MGLARISAMARADPRWIRNFSCLKFSGHLLHCFLLVILQELRIDRPVPLRFL